MENQLAASAAHGYSRRFWSRLKPKLRTWDFVMGIIPAAIVPAIQHWLFTYCGWWTYAISVLVAYAIFFVVYVVVKAILLLIARDKQLEIAEIELPKVKDEIRNEHFESLEHLSDEGHFWVYYANQTPSWWTDGVSRWSQHTTKQLSRNYGEATAQTFNTFDGMDKTTIEGLELRYLNWRLKNLREIIQNLSARSAAVESPPTPLSST